MIDWVDVRDYGAVGDGVTDDTAAFLAADAAADGRDDAGVGGHLSDLASNLTINNRIRFEGTVVDARRPAGWSARATSIWTPMPPPSAASWRGSGGRLQALFYFTDHVTLDLSGRRVDLTEPIDVAALCGLTSFSNRRVLTQRPAERA